MSSWTYKCRWEALVAMPWFCKLSYLFFGVNPKFSTDFLLQFSGFSSLKLLNRSGHRQEARRSIGDFR
jgi:hypothetical protein